MEQIANREHQSNDSFHRDSPDAWRTALLVEGIIGALRQINHSQKRTACCLLLARIRPKQTTVLAAATETLLSVLPPAKDQGNRVKNSSCDETCEEVVVPSGDFAFESEAIFAGGFSDQIEGHVSQRGEIGGGVVGADTAFVVAEDHVHHPV